MKRRRRIPLAMSTLRWGYLNESYRISWWSAGWIRSAWTSVPEFLDYQAYWHCPHVSAHNHQFKRGPTVNNFRPCSMDGCCFLKQNTFNFCWQWMEEK